MDRHLAFICRTSGSSPEATTISEAERLTSKSIEVRRSSLAWGMGPDNTFDRCGAFRFGSGPCASDPRVFRKFPESYPALISILDPSDPEQISRFGRLHMHL